MKQCRAKKKNGRECRRVSGWGTEHMGSGRCREHDIIGSSTQAQLAKVESSRIKSLAVEFSKDKDPFELREEIAITRATLAGLLEQIDDNTDLVRVIPPLNMLLNTCGKLVQRLHDIEVGRQYVVRVDVVQRSLQQVLALIVDYVPSPQDRAVIAERLSNLRIGEPSPKIKPTELNTREHELVSIIEQ